MRRVNSFSPACLNTEALSFLSIRSQAGVSMMPGAMALTRIGASSKASPRVKPSMAAFRALPKAKLQRGFWLAVPPKNVIDPPFLIRGAPCFAALYYPQNLLSK